jgi:hypothetical protein
MDILSGENKNLNHNINKSYESELKIQLPFIDTTGTNATAWQQLSTQDKTINNIRKYMNRHNSKSYLGRNLDQIETTAKNFNSVMLRGNSLSNFNIALKTKFNSKEKLQSLSPSRKTRFI